MARRGHEARRAKGVNGVGCDGGSAFFCARRVHQRSTVLVCVRSEPGQLFVTHDIPRLARNLSSPYVYFLASYQEGDAVCALHPQYGPEVMGGGEVRNDSLRALMLRGVRRGG